MNKRFLALTALVLVFAMGLSACGCAHETWTDADCLNPKTCAECGETEGEALGHNWKDADCLTAKTCQRCGTTEGEALGHSWKDATCAAPKTCERCELTEGEALPHTWTDATTEAPKTCSVCGATEGERIITDPRFTTANTLGLYGEWVCDVSLPGSLIGLADFASDFEMQIHMTLSNDGNATMTLALQNADEISADLVTYMCNLTYASLAETELTKEEIDTQFKDTYGMTMTEYYTAYVDSMDLAHIFDALAVDGVYYTEDGEFYISEDWDDTMDVNDYTLDGDTLTLHDDPFGLGMEDAVFTRVTE